MFGTPPRCARWSFAAVTFGASIVGSPLALAQQIRFEKPTVFVRVDRGKVDDPQAPARLATILSDLASADPFARCRADRALAEDPGISLGLIESAIKEQGEQLSLDTRERLCTSARLRFNQSPRAAMGIQFWQNFNLRDRVIIERTFPEYDANRKIEDGDMIVEADGVKIAGPSARNKFQAIIVSHDPGDVIPLVIRRGDRKVTTEVQLGRRDSLPNGANITPDILDRAWRVRAAAILGPMDKPFSAPERPENWTERPGAGGFQRQADRPSRRLKGGATASPALVGGGVARGNEQLNVGTNNLFDQRQIVLRRNGQVFFNPAMMAMAQVPDPFSETGLPPMSPKDELVELTRMRAQFAQNAGKPAQLRPGIPDAPRITMQELQNREVQLVEKQIDAIRAELIENGEPVPDIAEAATHEGADKAQPEPGQP